MDVTKYPELAQVVSDILNQDVYRVQDDPEWMFVVKDDYLNPLWELSYVDGALYVEDPDAVQPPMEFTIGNELYLFIYGCLALREDLPKPDPDDLIPF